MMHHFLSYSMILSVLLTLSGCAGMGQDVSVPTMAVARACHANIELAGRFSVRYWRDGQEQAVHGNFHWQQAGERTSVALLSPLGQTLATIELTPEVATLTLAGKVPRTAADADALAAEALGWPLPVAGLRGWLQGCVPMADGGSFVASPGKKSEVRTDDGWQLHYLAWEPDGVVLRPKRIDLERQTGGGEVSLRLVIDGWRQGGK